MTKSEKDYLKKLEETKECDNAKSLHKIFIADADEYSKQLKDKERNEKDRQKESIR